MISIFWTGGFDSTFRLCQLIKDGEEVQPIYLNMKNVDSQGESLRENSKIEKQTMNKIRQYLYKKYPGSEKLLKPTLIINKLKPNNKITIGYKLLHYNLEYFSRPITQYERMARFSWDYPTTVESCVENADSGFNIVLRKYKFSLGKDCRIKNKKFKGIHNMIHIFDKLRFPICHLTKDDMIKEAKENNFYDVLKMTWSCWFPKNGKACGKCDMCIHRPIKHLN